MRQAGLYLRISRDVTGEGLAVERQRADGLRLIEQRGWTLHREYIDNDISAAGRKKRPGFEDLLRAVEAREITVIVSLSLDRLTRNRRDQLRLIETCHEHSILVALVRGSDVDMTSAVGRAMADMMAVWARMEIEQKSERHISQIAQAAQAGRIVGGRRAFGYTEAGELHPREARVVRDLYDQWLTGTDLSAMARALNDAGHVTARGNRWTRGSVREVLANPRNAGLRGMRDVVNKRTGTRAQWHRIVGPAEWPAIVPEETWRAAVARIRDPQRPGSHRGIYPSRHLLPGLAQCGQCGLPMVAGRRDGKRLIRCASNRHVSRDAQLIEDYVEAVVIARFLNPEFRDLLAARHDVDETGARALRSRAVDLRARLDGFARDYADGTLDRGQMRVASDRVRAELADVEGRLATAGAQSVTARLLATDDVAAEWDGMPLPRRREVIRTLMRVTVLPGSPGRPGGLRFHPSSVRIEWA